MTNETLEQVRHAALAEKARRSLEDFTTYTFPESGTGPYNEFHMGWHHRLIFEKLEAWVKRDIEKLIITLPPRRGKSEIVSRRLPAWLLGKNPREEVLFATHTQDFAEKQCLDVQRILRSKRYRNTFDTEIDGSGTQKEFSTTEGGKFKAIGLSSGSAGADASRLIIDDYFRNREMAQSEAERKKIWMAFADDMMPRMYYPPSVIVMATRWHHDDLIGRILESPEADDWEVVHLPEMMDLDDPHPDDPRKPGEILFPWWFKKHEDEDVTDDELQRRGSEHFDEIKERNAFTAESLYQGRPSPREGGLFKREWMQQYDQDPRSIARTCSEVMISCDAAFKKTSSSDYVSCVVLGRRGTDIYVLDEVFDRMDYPETKQALKNLAGKWPSASLLIEEKANGSALISELRRVLNRVIPFEPGNNSKEARAQRAADAFEARQFWLPSPTYAPWIGDFIEDLVGFPSRAHDDRVDAVAQAAIRWTTNTGVMDHLRRICGT